MARFSGYWNSLRGRSRYISWIVGLFLVLIALTTLTTGEGILGRTRAVLAALIFLGAALLTIPPTRHRIVHRSNIEISGIALVAIIVLAVAAGMFVSPGTTDDAQSPDLDEAPADDLPIQDEVHAAETTPTPTPEGPQVERLFAEHLGELGLETGIAEDGSTIVFALNNGDLLVFDETGESDRLEPRPDSQASQLEVSVEHDRIALLYQSLDLFGVITIDGADVSSFEFPWVWEIDSTPDMETIVAVTSPATGAGSLGYATEGQVQWQVDFEESTGYDVAVSETGNYTVVGADYYMTEDAEMVGWTGVMLYDDTGEELWTYETDEAVISVGIHEGEDFVVAGTDDGRLLAFDLEGDLLWQDDEWGGWVHLSGDGSSVVSAYVSELMVFDRDGDERWSAPVRAGFGFDLSVSHDGETVLLVDRGQGNATVVREGEVIWEVSFEAGPITGDLAADGQTWSIILEDLEEEVAWGFAYQITN